MTTKECIFCGMSQGSVDTDTLYRDEQIIVVRDINPKASSDLPSRCLRTCSTISVTEITPSMPMASSLAKT